MTTLDLVVRSAAPETPLIRRVVLESQSGAPLPAFAPGAHLTLSIPGIGPRKYSLVRTVAVASEPAPTQYILGIRRDDQGGGGSLYMHGLKVGDAVTAEPPKNDFPLKDSMGPVALVGGGIGITPLIAMTAELKATGRSFKLVYAARERSELAFLTELRSLAGDALELHIDAEAGRVFDMGAYFAALPADAQVYMCGPKPMLKAGMDACKALGWPRSRLSFELFYSAAAANVPPPPAPLPPAAPVVLQAAPSEGAFEIVVKSTGQSFLVPPGKSILDVLLDAGFDPLHDCKRGECGVCQVGVIEGVPDHRDSILSDSERAANTTIQICISRAKSARLVLDL